MVTNQTFLSVNLHGMRYGLGKVAAGTMSRSNKLTWQRYAEIGIYAVSALLFLAWWLSSLFSSTELVSGTYFWWRFPVTASCTLVGAGLGYTLVKRAQRSSRVPLSKAALSLSTATFALIYSVVGSGLADCLANSYIFRKQIEEARYVLSPIKVAGIGRGARRYVELVGFDSVRFDISKLDFETLSAAAHSHPSTRYCLSVSTERVDQNVRVRLPRIPRPSVSGRTRTIIECRSGAASPILIS